MSSSPTRAARRRNPFVALALVIGLLAGVVGITVAGAATTLSPGQPGAGVDGAHLIRDTSLTLSESPGGAYLNQTGLQQLGCAAQNLRPSTTFVITDPTGVEVLNTTLTGPGAKSTTFDLTDRPHGVYEVTTKVVDRRRDSSSLPCVAVPKPDEVQHFEFRPWQQVFTDVLGNGRVQFNLTPVAESAQALGTTNGDIVAGGITTYGLPDGSGFVLPSDPAACGADPASCLPASAYPCDVEAGCVPRIVVIHRSSPTEALSGVFDLDTRAFIAAGRIGGTYRTLLSLGSDADGYYRDTLEQIAAAATAQGIDLGTILATTVRLRTGASETRLSLLNGLQIDPTTAGGGIQIVSDFSANAGIVFYLGIGTAPKVDGACPASGSSADGADGYVPPPGAAGLKAARLPIDLPALPDVPLPALPVAGAPTSLPVGDVFHVETVGSLAGVFATVIGASTEEDAPTGLPVWVAPVDGVPLVESPERFEFLGTGSWSSTYNDLVITCLNTSTVIGVGVALVNNPLPLGLGDLVRNTNPLVAPVLRAVMAQVNLAVGELTGELTANPTVQGLLEQVLGAVAGV
jgi:hypothetical protein